eukprot:Polyplicarium_translucidae@DN2807_c0_g1_i4.p1
MILSTDDADVVGEDPHFDPHKLTVKHPMNGGAEPPPQSQAPAQPMQGAAALQHHAVVAQQSPAPYGAVRRPPAGAVSRAVNVADPYGGPARQTPVVSRVDGSIVSINDLNMFTQKWTIKARVGSKSDMKTYNNAKGEGKFFGVDLIDKDGGEIRSTFFNKAADKFWPLLEENEVYVFSRGQVKSANKKFNPLRHSCELSFGEDAQISPVGPDAAIPKKSYVFSRIDSLNDMKKGDTVDVLAVIVNGGTINSITLKTGEAKDKRDWTLLDESGYTIDLTLWGEKCRLVDEAMLSQHPVVALKGAKVDEYQGRKLSVSFETKIDVNPDLPQTAKLIRWFQERGESTQITSLSRAGGPSRDMERSTLSQINQAVTAPSAAAALEDKGLWFSTIATLHRFDTERRYFWIACPDCNKKVQDLSSDDGLGPDGNGSTYFCGQCNKTVPKPNKKYILTIDLKDSTDSLRCNAIADHAQNIMGHDCSVVTDARDRLNNGMDDHDFFLWKQHREYLFRIQAKFDVYMDEKRIKYKIFGSEPMEGDTIAREAQSRLALAMMLLKA